nr:unnamed protein product [Callosobruchus chinensis]
MDANAVDKKREDCAEAGGISDPFKRRDKMMRSPPRRGSFSLVEGKLAGAGMKRRREEKEESSERDISELRDMLKKLEGTARNLMAVVKSIPNTKNEIKKGVTELVYQAELAQRKCDELEFHPREVKTQKVSVVKQCVSVGTQTEHVKQPPTGEDLQIKIMEIKKAIREGTCFDDLGKLLDVEWPEGVFERVKAIEEDIVGLAKKRDIAVILDPKQESKGIIKDLCERYTDIKELLDEGYTDGKIEFVTSQTTTSRHSGDKTTTIYLLPLTIDPNGVNDMKMVYDMLKDLMERISKNPIGSCLLITQEGLNPSYVRKMGEFLLRDGDLNIDYMTHTSRRKGNRRTQISANRDENLIIKVGERNYADLLREVKQKVDVEKIGVNVKSLRKTGSGDIMMTLEGGKDMANTLQKEIKDKIAGANTTTWKNERVIHITDLDVLITEEDLQAELRKALGVDNNNVFRVSGLRPTKDGNQAATIIVDRNLGAELLRKGRLKVGLVQCRLWERVTVTRCYRCLVTGHSAKDCKGPDRSQSCLNCGQEGHRAKECQGKPQCVRCQKEGHRVDSSKCPAYRGAIAAARKRAR